YFSGKPFGSASLVPDVDHRIASGDPVAKLLQRLLLHGTGHIAADRVEGQVLPIALVIDGVLVRGAADGHNPCKKVGMRQAHIISHVGAFPATGKENPVAVYLKAALEVVQHVKHRSVLLGGITVGAP